MAKNLNTEELIKKYNNARAFIRNFYVYGFMNKEEFPKSARTFDAEKKRIESWLKPYMRFERDDLKKRCFIAVDSREMTENPLYQTLKTSTFTFLDVLLHFLILDVLTEYPEGLTKEDILDQIDQCQDKLDAPVYFETGNVSSVDRKLKELMDEHGIIRKEKMGKTYVYQLNQDRISLEAWHDAIAFFSETSLLGVIGSFILDKFQEGNRYFRFKKHFIFNALDSEILEQLLLAIASDQQTEIVKIANKGDVRPKVVVWPLKIFVSTQNGRQYLLGFSEKENRFFFNRIDLIDGVTILKNRVCDPDSKKALIDRAEVFSKNVWGTSTKRREESEHLEMTVFADDDESYVVRRLKQEKRNGVVTQIDKHHWCFATDVYDTAELLPWIRTFIGRITNLSSSNPDVIKRFETDLKKTAEIYGVDLRGEENDF